MINSPDAYSKKNTVSFVRGGSDYFAVLLELIASAKKSLHLQTYIFAEDETGSMVAIALKKAAAKGVVVYLVVDGYASQKLSDSFIDDLKSAGIQFRFFEPLFRSRRFYLGRRLHHKVVVADMNVALVGGVNVADHYNDMPGKPAWLDFALRVEGVVVRELLILCQKTWNGFKILTKAPFVPPSPAFDIPINEQKNVRIRRNDWVRRKYDISQSYMEMFTTAEAEIVILSSYFLPGTIFRKAIRKARLRGVEVVIIVAAISDVKVAKMAERFMYEWLLLQGVKIYEYTKTVLHGKLAICDQKWITLGSFNVNDISTYASVELNLDVADPSFAAEVREHLYQNIRPHCKQISKSYIIKRTFFQRIAQRLAFGIVRVLFYFFTFYFKQEEQQTTE